MKHNGLIICPSCSERGSKQVLGSLDINGVFSVMRFRFGVTYIKATNFMVVCVCGFGTVVNTQAQGNATVIPTN